MLFRMCWKGKGRDLWEERNGVWAICSVGHWFGLYFCFGGNKDVLGWDFVFFCFGFEFVEVFKIWVFVEFFGFKSFKD